MQSYDKAILLNPKYAEAYCNRGSVCISASAIPGALESYDKAILLKPDFVEAYNNRGNTLNALQQYQAALESFDKAILLKPGFVEAHNNRGNTLHALQQYQAALESCDKAVLLKPDFAEAHNNRGNALYALQQYQAALESYGKAVLLKPDFAEAHNNRGNAFQALEQYQAALESYDKTILLKPEYAQAHNNRGSVLHALQQYQAALESYDKAILLNPDCAEAYNNRGNTLHALQQYQAALESCNKAIYLNAELGEGYNNLGITLYSLQQYEAALASFDKAIRSIRILRTLTSIEATTLLALKSTRRPCRAMTRLILLKPGYEYCTGLRMYMKRFLCDWEDIESECRQLEAAIDRGEKAAIPFTVLAVSGSPELQRQAAEIYVRDKAPAPSIATVFSPRPKRDRIRIGYFSADYFNHANQLSDGRVVRAARSQPSSKLLGFSFGPDIVDEVTQRISTAMDQFLDLRSMTDREAAQLSRKLEVDIAVDLKGFTRDNRTGIFAQRAAPIQVNYLGYPGTMGAELHGLSHRRPYADSRSQPASLFGKDRLSAGQLSGQRFPASHLRNALHSGRRGSARDGICLLLFQ